MAEVLEGESLPSQLKRIRQGLIGLKYTQWIVDRALLHIKEMTTEQGWTKLIGGVNKDIGNPDGDGVNPDDVGKGKIAQCASWQDYRKKETAWENSSEEQDKSAKVIVLLGVDSDGSGYIKSYLERIKNIFEKAKLMPEEVAFHHTEPDVPTRKKTAIGVMDEPDYYSEQAAHIVKKYIVPRLLDESGGLREDPTLNGNMDVTLFTHSWGGALATAVQNALREALTGNEASKWDLTSEKYSPEIIQKIFNAIGIASIGIQMPLYEEQKLTFPTLHFLSSVDSIAVTEKTTYLALVAENVGAETVAIYHDPNHADRKIGILPAQLAQTKVGKFINVSGHSLIGYLEAMSKCPEFEQAFISMLSRQHENGNVISLQQAIGNLESAALGGEKKQPTYAQKEDLARAIAANLKAEEEAWKESKRAHPQAATSISK